MHPHEVKAANNERTDSTESTGQGANSEKADAKEVKSVTQSVKSAEEAAAQANDNKTPEMPQIKPPSVPVTSNSETPEVRTVDKNGKPVDGPHVETALES